MREKLSWLYDKTEPIHEQSSYCNDLLHLLQNAYVFGEQTHTREVYDKFKEIDHNTELVGYVYLDTEIIDKVQQALNREWFGASQEDRFYKGKKIEWVG